MGAGRRAVLFAAVAAASALVASCGNGGSSTGTGAAGGATGGGGSGAGATGGTATGGTGDGGLQPGTCSDAKLNGGETDVDCGGPCGPCLPGQGCSVNGDCATGHCASGKCAVAPGTYLWSHAAGDTGDDYAYSIAVDPAGNAYMTGRFQGTIDWGGGKLTSAGDFDVFVVKFDPSGKHLWSKSFGGPGVDRGFAVAVEPSGGVIVTGNFAGTVSFGGAALTSGKEFDAFVLKLDKDGNHVWSQSMGGDYYDWGFWLAVDPKGDVYVSGLFSEEAKFGAQVLDASGWLSTGSVAADVFVAKIAAAGDLLWAQRYGGDQNDEGSSIALDAAGNIYATGYFQDTIDFGGAKLTSAGAQDIYVVKLDPTGKHVWSHAYGGPGEDEGYAVAVDPATSTLYMTGLFTGPLTFGGDMFPEAAGGPKDYDAYLVKLDAQGNHVWSKRFGSPAADRGYSIAFDGGSNVYLAGNFGGPINFGGDALASKGDSDFFVAAFDADGVPQWSRGYGAEGADSGNTVAINTAGDLYVGAAFSSVIDLGKDKWTSAGQRDLLIMKLGAAPAVPPK